MFHILKTKTILCCVFLIVGNQLLGLTNNSQSDYYPLYKTTEPHSYLYTRTKEQMHGRVSKEKDPLNKFSFSISPFGQNAEVGKNFDGQQRQLGSLSNNWSMLGLVMGELPQNQTLSTTLAAAKTGLYAAIPLAEPIEKFRDIDENEQFGFFEFPAIYRKKGIRFECSIGLFDDFGVSLQAGAADINMTVTAQTNLTPSDSTSGESALTTADVNTYLMNKLTDITQELDLNLSDFHKSSMEDIRLSGFWRRAFKVNKKSTEWPQLLVIPFIEAGASFNTGDHKDPLKAFALPFGNNGHNAAGCKGGINLDFSETVEIGFEFGYTHFFDKTFENMPMPTSSTQSGIYPFKTSAKVSPGFNWDFTLKLNADHFLDKFSFYFQWVVMEHKYDKIRLTNCSDTAFKPEVLEKRSGWKAQFINTALHYDISPNIGLGFAWQAPIVQRNVFRSTTIMLGIDFSF